MFKKTYNVIGVMSGTSLDGIDLAHIYFTVIDGKWEFEILESETVSYGNDWLNKLKTAVDFSKAELKKLNEDYTAVLADRKSTRLNSSHHRLSRMPSSA